MTSSRAGKNCDEKESNAEEIQGRNNFVISYQKDLSVNSLLLEKSDCERERSQDPDLSPDDIQSRNLKRLSADVVVVAHWFHILVMSQSRRG